MHNQHRKFTRPQRTAIQCGVPGGMVVVAAYILSQLGYTIPKEVLVPMLGGLIYAFSWVQNLAEDNGWIVDRRA